MPVSSRRTLDPGLTDPVERWKVVARIRLLDEQRVHSGKPLVVGRVTPGFFLLMAFTQLVGLRFVGPASAASALVLPSILLAQELPRAMLARRLGRSSKITISAAGGQTDVTGPPLQGAAAIAFASIGSAVNLLVAAGAAYAAGQVGGVAQQLCYFMAGSHATWGLAQALPLVPFRAGLAMGQKLSPQRRFLHAGGSLVLLNAASMNIHSAPWAVSAFPVLMLTGLACWRRVVETYQESRDEQAGIARLCAAAQALLAQGQPAGAAQLARQGLSTARSARQRTRLHQALAWAAIGTQDPILAHQAVGQLPAEAIDLHLIAAYLACCNRIEEAVRLLEETRAAGHRAPETIKLLIDLLFRSGKAAAALELARAERGLLSAEDWSALEAALGEHEISSGGQER